MLIITPRNCHERAPVWELRERGEPLGQQQLQPVGQELAYLEDPAPLLDAKLLHPLGAAVMERTKPLVDRVEVLAATGLLLPSVWSTKAGLTPLSAAGLVPTMMSAAAPHVTIGEGAMVATSTEMKAPAETRRARRSDGVRSSEEGASCDGSLSSMSHFGSALSQSLTPR